MGPNVSGRADDQVVWPVRYGRELEGGIQRACGFEVRHGLGVGQVVQDVWFGIMGGAKVGGACAWIYYVGTRKVSQCTCRNRSATIDSLGAVRYGKW